MPHRPDHQEEGGSGRSPIPAPAPPAAPPAAPPTSLPPGMTLGPGGSIVNLSPPSAPAPPPAAPPAAPPGTPGTIPLPPGFTLGPGGSLEGAITPSGPPTVTADDMASGNFTPLTPPAPEGSTLGASDPPDTSALTFEKAFDAVQKASDLGAAKTTTVQPPGTMAPMTVTGTTVSLVTKPEVPVTEQVRVTVLATGVSTGATQEITLIINP